jgi:pyruvate carboxylase subunit B
MKYRVAVAGRQVVVEISPTGVTVDGKPVECEWEAVPGTPVRLLRLGGTVKPLVLSRDGKEWVVEWAGERVRARVEVGGLVGSGVEKGALVGGESIVKAPMPGLVLRVEVEAGQRVEVGSGLVVLEAMKMENEIRSPRRGVVRRVWVQAGQAVEKGAELVEIREEQTG